MANSTTHAVDSSSTDLFDRYTLPKIALTIILFASLVGTIVTTRLTSGWALLLASLKWGYFVALGVLAGGLLWKHLFVRPEDLDADTGTYCARMYDRFDRIITGTLVILTVTAGVVLHRIWMAGISPVLFGGLVASVGSLVGLQALRLVRSRPVTDQFRSPVGLGTLTITVVAIVLTAIADVQMRGGDPVAMGIRIFHLLAFAGWLGGAVWNIFVAVPTGQNRPTVNVVRAAGQQLERFRWTVRFIIPTIFLTGLYQAIDALGTAIPAYLTSPVGLLVASKLGFIGLLVVIFKLCPMWRACSPIEGVCELDDLGEGTSEERDPVSTEEGSSHG